LLTRDNETFDHRPLIARELPEISEDKLRYTFRMREDVTYSDGRPATANDVVFMLKAIKNPRVLAPHLRNYYQHVRSATALDDYTVQFEMSRPYFKNMDFLGGLSPMPQHHYDPEGQLADITVEELADFDSMSQAKQESATAFAKSFNVDFNRDPLGAGAYYIRDPNNDIRTGERIVLYHRDDYWGAGDPDLGDGYVDRVVFRIINDAEAALVAFKSRDLDVMGLTPLQHMKSTGSSRFAKRSLKKVSVSPRYDYIGWNANRPLFADKSLRQALRYFIDKDNLIERVLFGLGVPVEGPIFVERPEYDHDLPTHVFDPEEGKRRLAEAGWKDLDGDGVLDRRAPDGSVIPLKFEIMANSGNAVRKAMGLAIIDEMRRAGIKVSLRELDWTIMLERLDQLDYDAVLLAWGMSITEPDPYQIWHSSQRDGGSNRIGFANAEVDRILEANREEFDPEKRRELMLRFQKIIHEEQPYTFLYMPYAITAWDRRFHGVQWYPSGSTDLFEWWVPEPLQRYE
jgi:peptide/nickel transport system substrate-binding protein